METPNYTLAELSAEDAAALTAEITAVLEKYQAEIGVKSVIEILKRVPLTPEEPPVPSPFMTEEQ